MTEPKLDRRNFLVAGMAIGAAAGGLQATRSGTQLVGAAHAATGAGRMTLHAIDTYLGQTREGLKIDLSRQNGDSYELLTTVHTVPRGRTENPIIAEGELQTGRYELLMHLDDYFAEHGNDMPSPPFLSKVPIRFGVFDANQNFHIPILFSPWSYSYYRGS